MLNCIGKLLDFSNESICPCFTIPAKEAGPMNRSYIYRCGAATFKRLIMYGASYSVEVIPLSNSLFIFVLFVPESNVELKDCSMWRARSERRHYFQQPTVPIKMIGTHHFDLGGKENPIPSIIAGQKSRQKIEKLFNYCCIRCFGSLPYILFIQVSVVGQSNAANNLDPRQSSQMT